MTTAEYPVRFESDVVLRTGRTVHIRPVRPEDCDRLIAFYAHLSPESLHARFFAVCRPEVAAAASPSTVDYDREFGAVAELGGEIAGVAHYFTSRTSPNVAEVAFAISDAAQGCGAGTKLLETLVTAARDHGIERFVAEVLPENQRMLDVFLSTGFDVVRRSDEGVVHLEFPIAATAASAE
ncbi:MAG TPA: GNAT family N-acetyltransferase, partial [Thermoanaerobaculia bacterium]